MDEPRKLMKRREVAGGFRYLTFSCYRRVPLLGTPTMRDLVARAIESARVWCDLELFAWVIMPEHVHLLLRPDGRNFAVDDILHRIKKPVAALVLSRWKKVGAPVLPRITSDRGRVRFWQSGGGFDRNPRFDGGILKEIAYIHHNPVKRGLVAQPTDWAWSSATWYAGDRDGVVRIAQLPHAFAGMYGTIVSNLGIDRATGSSESSGDEPVS